MVKQGHTAHKRGSLGLNSEAQTLHHSSICVPHGEEATESLEAGLLGIRLVYIHTEWVRLTAREGNPDTGSMRVTKMFGATYGSNASHLAKLLRPPFNIHLEKEHIIREELAV